MIAFLFCLLTFGLLDLTWVWKASSVSSPKFSETSKKRSMHSSAFAFRVGLAAPRHLSIMGAYTLSWNVASRAGSHLSMKT